MDGTNSKPQTNFFLFLLISAFVIAFFIFKPFLTSLVLAFSFAIIFEPINKRITTIVGGRRGIGALLTVLLTVIIVLIPLIFMGGLLFDEVKGLYENFSNGSGVGIIENAITSVERYTRQIAPDTTVSIANYLQSGLQWVVNHLDSFFAGFIHIIFSLLVMLVALFYLLKDGSAIRQRYMILSPLSNNYDETILSKLASTINSVVKGSLVIAVVQGSLAALGTWIFGMPTPIIWGLFAMFASFVPGLGTSIVMVPAIIYLFVTGTIGNAIGLLVWQIFVVGLVDNFLAPYLIHRGLKIHPFLILISVLGGITFFGPIGFILGPIMLAFLFALIDIYPLIIK